MIPRHAKLIPDQPNMDNELPLKKMDNKTEKIFLVVVTVDSTSGSKWAKV